MAEQIYTKGIIRSASDTKKVFRASTQTLATCYYDSYIDRYCVEGYMTEWKTRDVVSSEGWDFVDGTQTLYNGTTAENIIIDNDRDD